MRRTQRTIPTMTEVDEENTEDDIDV